MEKGSIVALLGSNGAGKSTTLKVISGFLPLEDGKKFISALIQIEFENVGKWATNRQLAYTTFKSLSMMPEVNTLIQEAVDKSNAKFARVENVRKFILLTKELDHDDNEMTATMKVRRATIYKKFAGEIEMIYNV